MPLFFFLLLFEYSIFPIQQKNEYIAIPQLKQRIRYTYKYVHQYYYIHLFSFFKLFFSSFFDKNLQILFTKCIYCSSSSYMNTKKWKTVPSFYSFPLFIQLYRIFEIGILGPSPDPYSPSKILSNSSPSIFSFSIKTFATACNLSICSFKIFVALSYPASTIFLTSSSIIAAVSSE